MEDRNPKDKEKREKEDEEVKNIFEEPEKMDYEGDNVPESRFDEQKPSVPSANKPGPFQTRQPETPGKGPVTITPFSGISPANVKRPNVQRTDAGSTPPGTPPSSPQGGSASQIIRGGSPGSAFGSPRGAFGSLRKPPPEKSPDSDQSQPFKKKKGT